MIVDYATIDETKKYKLMSQSIIPRPIAWIVTEDDSVINIAPFSYFAPLSSKPPLLVVSIGKKENGNIKDTRANILKNKKATICFATLDLLEKLKLSSTEIDKLLSEAKEYNIELVDMQNNYPPIIKGVESAMFCDFRSFIDIQSETLPLILEVKEQYIQDDLCDEKLNVTLSNICRVGRTFAKLTNL
ncbi:MAG: flavin reductase family protein [Arcobacteraceae bacterium]|nr:flavin reductase family protein [Arcobacteraceae bacterium]MDY0364344.1 flavin reductase family protein [Arcobacteraceae bacterium]